ncbi:TraR/DksA family transcriptional regulator [Microbacterium koreense]|uniref:TraR/DksA family transcriptional regulator n=1 Tax=Microbacterium koreense TaxID=323761 RepID=A0ABW2ZMT9_9MICO
MAIPLSDDVRPALDLEGARRDLEARLQAHLDVIADLAPHALPTIDPVAYQTVTTNRQTVSAITAALNRLDAGTYGVCIRCGTEIPPARLEAVPHAAACVPCQSRVDAG